MTRSSLAAAPLLVLLLAGCGGDDTSGGTGGDGGPPCSVKTQTGCVMGMVCEEVEGQQNPACFAPISFQGKVFGALDMKPIPGARVVARDANDAVVSTVAITGMDGAYTLNVPTKRNVEGAPLKAQYTLRADAAAFQTFPTAPRIALPIDISTATGSPLVVKSAATDIAMLPLPNASGLGSISGKVVADAPGGTLVVAGGVTGVADFTGNYQVFNVPAGSGVAVAGYAAGLQIKPASADVAAGKDTPNITLTSTGPATATVSGSVSIVNGGGASSTSVVLAVEDTFNANAARGEVPRGLRVANVTGAFSIPNVPDGKYVVLAAFENDGLVRDPDMSIGGTQIVHITVAGQSQPIATSFKITGALPVVSPGADKLDVVSGTPSFVWGDDSGEDHYEIHLFDAYGNEVWKDVAIPGVSGNPSVTATYGGAMPLQSGMIYQFRAISIKKGGTAIATTEDLKGVFAYK